MARTRSTTLALDAASISVRLDTEIEAAPNLSFENQNTEHLCFHTISATPKRKLQIISAKVYF